MRIRDFAAISGLALAAAPGALAQGADEAAVCEADMEAPIVAPSFEPEQPEGYVECIDADELYAGLIEFTSSWATCFEAADAACLADLYSDDAMLAPDGAQAVHGAGAIEDYFAEVFGAYGQGASARIAFRYEQVDAGEDETVLLQNWRTARSGPEEADNLHRSGRTVQILQRGDDGAWEIWLEINNNIPDADPEDWPEGLF